jgi:hypothetical protein
MISGSRDLKHVGDTVVKLVLPVGISLNVLWTFYLFLEKFFLKCWGCL